MAAAPVSREAVTDIRIGTSGWNYPHWRNEFYPSGLPARRQLEYLSGRLDSVEINGSFYSLQRPSSYRQWRDVTPAGFLFAVKGGRFLTHNKKLLDVRGPLANFLASGPLALGDKLGPFLWQLPPVLRFSPARMSDFFALLPRTVADAESIARECDDRLTNRFGQDPVTASATLAPGHRLRHAVEVRHPSFVDDAFYELCEAAGVAVVLADTAGKFPWIERPTADFGYFRLHGSQQLYASGYTDAELDQWAQRIDDWRRKPGVRAIYVYFDNDFESHAGFDALRLRRRLGLPGSD